MKFQRVVKTSGKLLRTELAQVIHSGPQKEVTPELPWILSGLFKTHPLLISSREDRQGINKMIATGWETAGEGKQRGKRGTMQYEKSLFN